MVSFKNNIQSNIFCKKDKPNNLPLFHFSGLSKHQEILHFVTTRQGGYSTAPFYSFNLAFHVGDKKENVLKNRAKLAQFLHIPSQSFTISCQVHGTHISTVNQNERGSGASDLSNAIKASDAMITDQKGVCLLIFVADCVPVLLYDQKKQIIALVHAGWQGTVGLITQKTVYQMQSYWGCKSQDILCAIGPSIGPCCYQVGPEVISRVREVFPEEEYLINSVSAEGMGYFDLWEANKLQLLNCQIPEKNIEVAGLCTYCHSDLFFSSRKDGGHTGRFAAGIMLRK
jgi:polyphenol oxidase